MAVLPSRSSCETLIMALAWGGGKVHIVFWLFIGMLLANLNKAKGYK